jgi:hypothetical protein
MTAENDQGRAFLRHALATLAYRGGKTLRGATPEFASFRADEASRTPLEILTHLGDLLEWALSISRSNETWSKAEAKPWGQQVERFFAGLKGLDDYLASTEPLGCPPGQLFQGPVADALTHVGQLAMLRRMAGNPIRGENYFIADIATGRVGAEQAAPRREFD